MAEFTLITPLAFQLTSEHHGKAHSIYHLDENANQFSIWVLMVTHCSGCMEFPRRIHWLRWLEGLAYPYTVLVGITQSSMIMIWKGNITFLCLLANSACYTCIIDDHFNCYSGDQVNFFNLSSSHLSCQNYCLLFFFFFNWNTSTSSAMHFLIRMGNKFRQSW